MVLKTFNVNESVYQKFSAFCKEHGVSMSKQIEMFMEMVLGEEPQAKKSYLEKLEKIRKGRFLKVSDFAQKYGLK